MTAKDLGSRSKLVPGSYLWWYPAETNVPILHGWFWAEGKSSRTASELVDIYYQSVGRNSNWLLNLSPDNRGLIPDLQVANVRSMNRIVSATFATDLAKGAKLVADTSSVQHASRGGARPQPGYMVGGCSGTRRGCAHPDLATHDHL